MPAHEKEGSISEIGITTDPSKTCAVQEWPTPTYVTELWQFLGLASYNRKFVNGFANVVAPLHRLLEKGPSGTGRKPVIPPYICARPRLFGLPSAVHCRRGRQRRRPWGGAEPEGRENGKSFGVCESHDDQSRASVLRDSERNAQFGVGLARALAITLWPAIPGAHGP
ncbi:conserved hypothetical protein [Trichinella spiralis]|uniref:hypothetical protein n=1 Tax=Trichinella spiralis TaxID=6334 RepID=UPI0001EFD3A7|nr:conserved hypothetical protein [Trichinella spiralis]